MYRTDEVDANVIHRYKLDINFSHILACLDMKLLPTDLVTAYLRLAYTLMEMPPAVKGSIKRLVRAWKFEAASNATPSTQTSALDNQQRTDNSLITLIDGNVQPNSVHEEAENFEMLDIKSPCLKLDSTLLSPSARVRRYDSLLEVLLPSS